MLNMRNGMRNGTRSLRSNSPILSYFIWKPFDIVGCLQKISFVWTSVSNWSLLVHTSIIFNYRFGMLLTLIHLHITFLLILSLSLALCLSAHSSTPISTAKFNTVMLKLLLNAIMVNKQERLIEISTSFSLVDWISST